MSKKLLPVAMSIILILNIIVAVFVRVQDVDELQGKYMSGYDAHFYYRQAKIIVARGHLPDRDYMQYFPDGLDLRKRQNLNQYAIAYLYKFVRIFMPEVSIEKVAIYYPVLCFILILFVFFGMVSTFFDKSTSLIATTFFATIPAAVFRTHAGWASRDPLALLTWLMCIYFYVAAYQTIHRNKRYLLLALLSGVSIGINGLTWPGIGLLSIIIVVFNIVKLFTRTYQRQEFSIYLCWYAPSIFMMLTFSSAYSDVHSPYTLTAIMLPTVFAVIAGLDILIRQFDSRSAKKLFWSILAVSFISLLFVNPSTPKLIIERFLHPAGTDPVIKQVEEFQVSGLSTWLESYQLFVVFPLLGMLLVTYKLSERYGMHSNLLTRMLVVTIAVAIFSVIVPGTQQRFAEIVYIGSIILLVGTMVLSYFFRRPKGDAHARVNTDVLLFLFIWSLLTLFYTRGAVRFALFLVPPAVILGAYAIIFILKRITGLDEHQTLNLVILTSFMVLSWQLRTPFHRFFLNIGLDDTISFFVCWNLGLGSVIFLIFWGLKGFSSQQRKIVTKKSKSMWVIFSISMCIIVGGFPYLTLNWISLRVPMFIPSSDELKAFNWIKDNTSLKSVIAAWWDLGSRIEAISERATIIDQQHQNNRSWIQLMVSNVFCAETPEKALKFLKSHKATHLMILPVDVFGLKGISDIISSTKDLDRKISIKTFKLDENASKSLDLFQRKLSEQVFPSSIPHSNFLGYTTEHYTACYKKAPDTESVEIQYKSNASFTSFHEAAMFIDDMNISPKYILFDDNSINDNKMYENPKGTGCLVVTNVDVHNPPQILESKHAVYFDEKACKLLAFKLYFLGAENRHFKRVYPTREIQKEDTSSFNDIKIWEINY